MSLEDQVGKTKEEGPFIQFEECDHKSCKYYNEAGRCSFETCRIKTEIPQTATVILKKCKFCGITFATNYNEMDIQVCPDCLSQALAAVGHPHACMFCGATMDRNPSLFVNICGDCMSRLQQAMHCKPCGR